MILSKSIPFGSFSAGTFFMVSLMYLASASVAGRGFLESDNLRTRRWATTRRMELEKIGLTPIRSIIRAKAAEVELAWKDERTRWPVIEAWIAVFAVSASRISPTMTTSGSRRRTERRPSAKEAPSFV